MRKSLFAVVLAGIAIGLIAIAFYYFRARSWLEAPMPQVAANMVYEVPRGASISSTLQDLGKRGLIQHPRELGLWVRYSRPTFRLRAGEYALQPGMTPIDLIDLLASGKVVLHKITIVEGTTVADMRRIFAAESSLDRLTGDLPANDFLKKVGVTWPHGEGWFFPETYSFAKNTPDVEIYKLAHQRMLKELSEAWASRDSGLPLANEYEALILASIVEKESALASERPLIAGVFVERLRKGMRLQTDPTVIYGMGDKYDGNIRKADLLRDAPYNTYTRAGLPPTPICLPSAAAIAAAVHPKASGALYFVATGKGDGSHYFSATLEEHNAAIRRYLSTLRQR